MVPSEWIDANTPGSWEKGEEGFIYRGSQPPLADYIEGYSATDWIEIPHEHHIPISKYQLQTVLCGLLTGQQQCQPFSIFFKRLQAIYHLHYLHLLDQLKQDYEYFDPDGGFERRQSLTIDELKSREHRFLHNFVLALVDGHFSPFTEEYAQRAKEYDYLFDLSVKIKWRHHDQKLIDDFINTTNAEGVLAQALRQKLKVDKVQQFLQLPISFSNHALLFWRGIGRDKREERRFIYKLDILLIHLFDLLLFPIKRLIELLRGEKNSGEMVSNVSKDIKELWHVLTFNFFNQTTDPIEDAPEASKKQRTVSFQQRWIHRLNTQNQPVTLRNLFRPIQLQEPLLDKVICCFRIRQKYSLWVRLKQKFKKNQAITADGMDIYLKMFRQIPLADTLLVLPFKTPTMRSSDLSMLLVIIIGGILTLIQGLQSQGVWIGVVVGILIASLLRIIMSYQRAKLKYNVRMMQALYDKNLDNHTGVLQYLVDSIEQQAFKEAVLAYYALWHAAGPMTAQQLKQVVEQFIHHHFNGLEVDFEVQEALRKITYQVDAPYYLPLVEISTTDAGCFYQAKPLADVLVILENQWQQLEQ